MPNDCCQHLLTRSVREQYRGTPNRMKLLERSLRYVSRTAWALPKKCALHKIKPSHEFARHLRKVSRSLLVSEYAEPIVLAVRARQSCRVKKYAADVRMPNRTLNLSSRLWDGSGLPQRSSRSIISELCRNHVSLRPVRRITRVRKPPWDACGPLSRGSRGKKNL